MLRPQLFEALISKVFSLEKSKRCLHSTEGTQILLVTTPVPLRRIR